MPGMTSGVTTNDPVLQAAFWSALLRQFGVVALIFLVLVLAYGTLRLLAAGAPRPPRDRDRHHSRGAEGPADPAHLVRHLVDR